MMFDPLTQYDLIKLHMKEARERARQQALVEQAPRTKSLISAIALFRSGVAVRRKVQPLAEVCPDAECCIAC